MPPGRCTAGAETNAMRSTNLHRLIGVIAAVAVLLSFHDAGAYVLPGPYLVSRMLRSMGRTTALLVVQKQIIYGIGENQSPPEIHETLRFQFPNRFRADSSTDSTKRIYVQADAQALTLLDGRVAAADSRAELYKDLLLYRDRDLLTARLARTGVDINVSSLGHDGPRVFFVVGAAFPDTATPQLWIDKQTFLPLRWIVGSQALSEAQPRLEFRYLKWTQVGEGFWYPLRIECYRNETLIREIRVDSTRLNVTFGRDLFDIAALKSGLAETSEPAVQAAPRPKMDEVRKTIEEFKKIYH